MKPSLRNDIIKHLKNKGNYDSDVDDYVIDILIDNIEYSEDLKRDIKKNGCIIVTRTGNNVSVTKENPAYGTYVKCLTNIQQSAKQLGISRSDRLKLKLLDLKAMDDFDEDFK